MDDEFGLTVYELPDDLVALFLGQQKDIGSTQQDVTPELVQAAQSYLKCDSPTQQDVLLLGQAFDPENIFRPRGYIHPSVTGLPSVDVDDDFANKVDRAIADPDPFLAHVNFVKLHPLADANGRVARVIWLRALIRGNEERQKVQAWVIGFLHVFYYQAVKHDKLKEGW